MAESKKSFVFFSSWERYLKTLELDRDLDYVNAVARAIIQYGLSGEVESDDPTVLSRVEAVCSDLMQSNASRYNAAIKNGTQGGRPRAYDYDTIKALRDMGLTHQQIADELGCGTRTVHRVLKSIETSEEDEEI